ncbi:MAG: hypothetical protein KY456_13110 [Chloroflexi bacterium]|nr:hypothetical protein [Chloroflexota bacterium]
MRLYSYVVARDYGFAPNPFYGVCTLATCKPKLRKMASLGDWVVGTGSAPNGLTGHLVFTMKVTAAMDFGTYFNDPRFQSKKPNLAGSLKQAFGDNIYSPGLDGHWNQLDSHHSLEDGSPNPQNIRNDTDPDRLLLSDHFAYFGEVAPQIPDHVRYLHGQDLCAGRLYKVNFDAAHVTGFIDWFEGLGVTGVQGRPFEWRKNGALRRGA